MDRQSVAEKEQERENREPHPGGEQKPVLTDEIMNVLHSAVQTERERNGER